MKNFFIPSPILIVSLIPNYWNMGNPFHIILLEDDY